MTNFYDLLRIPRGSTADEIARAISSPPAGLAGDVVADAKRTLEDPYRRAEYDRALERDVEAQREFEAREAAYLHDDLPSALRHAARLAELRPDEPESWLQASIIAENAGDHALSAKFASRGTELHPLDARLWHRAAVSTLADAVVTTKEGESPEFEAGLALMERAVATDPGTRLYEYEHVRLLNACGRPLDAIRKAEHYILADRTIGFDDLPFLQLLFDLYMGFGLDMGLRGTATLIHRIPEEDAERRGDVAEALLGQIEAQLANGYGKELRYLLVVAAFAAQGMDRIPEEMGASLGDAQTKIELAEELPILRDDTSLVAEAATGFSLVALGREDESKRYRERSHVLREGILALGPETIRRDLDRLRERYPAVWDSFGETMEGVFFGEGGFDEFESGEAA